MTDTRRIVQVVPNLSGFGKGCATSLLATRLAEQGYEVHLLALCDDGPRDTAFECDQVQFSFLSRRRATDPTIWLSLRKELRRLSPAIVHSWGSTSFRFAATVAGSLGLKTFVATDPFPLQLSSLCLGRFDRWLVRRARRIVVSHCHVRDGLLREGFSAERIAVIPPGVEAAKPLSISREKLLAQLELQSNVRLIGVAGSLDAYNRIKEAIWAAELVYVLHKNSCLLIIGDGPRRAQLERFARLLDAEDRVRFLGHRPDAEQLLGLLDVFWSSSDCDPLQEATLQAMAAGVPVVASDIPGRETLISTGETGFLARVGSRTEFARPTDRLYQDSEIAQRIGEAGRQHVAKCFGLDQMVDQYVELYREL